MELHDLHPAKGAVRKSKRLGRGEASGKGGLLLRVIKVIKVGLVLNINGHTRVVRCHCKGECLSVVLRILFE